MTTHHYNALWFAFFVGIPACLGDLSLEDSCPGGTSTAACTSPAQVTLQARGMVQVSVDQAIGKAAADPEDDEKASLNEEPEVAAVPQSATTHHQKLEPHMSDDERDLFSKLLDSATNYFEFGTGGSTAWAVSRKNIKTIDSVENDAAWVQKLRQQEDIKTAEDQHRLNFHTVDTGPIQAWGLPTSEASSPKWPSYSDQILKNPTAAYDLVLVDGRFRVACALKALQHMKSPTAKIVIHDYDRKEYHKLEEFATIVTRVNRLAVFQKKPMVDEVKLAEAAKSNELSQMLQVEQ